MPSQSQRGSLLSCSGYSALCFGYWAVCFGSFFADCGVLRAIRLSRLEMVSCALCSRLLMLCGACGLPTSARRATSLNMCQAFIAKIFYFSEILICGISNSSRPIRGAYRDRLDMRVWDAVDAAALRANGIAGRGSCLIGLARERSSGVRDERR